MSAPTPHRSDRRSHRAGWALIDQALSSGSNFGVSIVAAHSLSPAQFGAFAIPFLVYSLALGVSTSIAAEPYTVRYGAVQSLRSRRSAERSSMLGTVAALGFVLSALGLSVGIVFNNGLSRALVALALVAPFLLLHDAVRQLGFADGRPQRAVLVDGLWVVGSCLALGCCALAGVHFTPFTLVLGWGAGAVPGAFIGWRRFGLSLAPASVKSWVAETRDVSFAFAIDFLLMSGAGQLVFYVVAFTSGLGDLGAYRGALLLFGPLSVAFTSFRSFGVAEGVGVRGRGGAGLFRIARLYGVVFVLMAGGYTLAAVRLPTHIGAALLGATWLKAGPLAVLAGLGMSGVAAGLAPFLGLRVLGASKQIVAARSVDATLMVVLCCAGAVGWGVRGAMTGEAVANSAAAVVWWRQFSLACRAADGAAASDASLSAR